MSHQQHANDEGPNLPMHVAQSIIDINMSGVLEDFSRLNCRQQSNRLAFWKTERMPMRPGLWNELLNINKDTCLLEPFDKIHTSETLEKALESIFEGSYEQSVHAVQVLDKLSLTLSAPSTMPHSPLSITPQQLFRLCNLQELYVHYKPFVKPVYYLGDLLCGGFNGESLSDFFIKVKTKLPKLKKLGLHGVRSHRLPKEIGELVELNTLVLDNCRLDNISSKFNRLVNLEILSLRNNQLKWHNLPDMSRCFKKLRSLDLSDNECSVHAFPEWFGRLDRLTRLKLTLTQEIEFTTGPGDPMHVVSDELFRLSNLEELCIHRYGYFYGGENGESMSEFFIKVKTKLPKLKKLSLSGVTSSFLPKEIGELVELDTLVLVDCGFFGISIQTPVELLQLTNLEVLALSKNHMSWYDFPDVGRHLKKLRSLDLSENQLTPEYSPDWIGQLPQLAHLNLSKNYFNGSSLPRSMQNLNALVTLELQRNYLTQFPDVLCKIPSLQNLDLSFNEIKTIPSDVGALVNLKNLNIKKNLLSAVPETVGRLTSLRCLDVSQNKFAAPFESIASVLDPRIFKELEFIY